MTAKAYLRQAYSLNGLIEADRQELAELRALAESIPQSILSDIKVQASPEHDKTGDLIAKIVDLETKINTEISRYIGIKKKIRRLISRVDDLRLREILQRRYLNFQQWDDISNTLGYTTRRVFGLHNQALLAFSKGTRFH